MPYIMHKQLLAMVVHANIRIAFRAVPHICNTLPHGVLLVFVCAERDEWKDREKKMSIDTVSSSPNVLILKINKYTHTLKTEHLIGEQQLHPFVSLMRMCLHWLFDIMVLVLSQYKKYNAMTDYQNHTQISNK